MKQDSRLVVKNVRVQPGRVWNDGTDRVSVSAVVFTPNENAAVERVEADLAVWRPDGLSPLSFHPETGLRETREGLYSGSFAVPLLADPGPVSLPIVAVDSLGASGSGEAPVLVSYRRPPYEGSILDPPNRAALDALSGTRAVAGNRVEALDQGNRAFEKRMALVRQARRQINLQTYSLAAEGRCERLVEAILEKAAEGVEVNLLLNLGSQLAVSPLTPLRIGLGRVGRELQGLLREMEAALEAGQGFWGAVKQVQEIFQKSESWARGLRVLLVDDEAILGSERKAGERGRRSQRWLAKMSSDRSELDRARATRPTDWFFRVIGPERLTNLPLLTYAVHEKILVVDGSKAIVGGRNLEDRYFTHWIDKDLYLEGPVVADIQRGFLRSWEAFARNSGKDLPALACDEPIDPAGPLEVRFVQSRPWLGEYHALECLVTAIQMARRRICVATQYVVLPEGLLREALLDAASRGVEILVLTNSYETGQEVGFAGGYLVSLDHCQDLLQHGIRVYEIVAPEGEGMPRPYLHAKEFLIDGEWAAVGSFNLSLRSSYIEAENLVSVEDPGFATAQEEAFLQRLRRDAREVTVSSIEEQRQRLGARLNLAKHLELLY
jgi:cardiolipin synthase